MNQPQFPGFPQQPMQPQYAPPQQYQQPMQPQPYPQQPMQPQYQQPGQPMPGAPISAFAQGNLMAQFLNEPMRQVVNRAKPSDGTYMVQITNAEQKVSQQNANEFLLIEYIVLDGTVPQMAGQKFGTVITWNNRGGLQDLAEIVKALWGPTGAQQMAAAGRGPSQIAGLIAQTVRNLFCKLVVVRSQKKLAAGVPYDQVFASHYWSQFSPQAFKLQMQAMPPAPQPGQFPPMQPQQQNPFPPQQPMQQPMQQPPAAWVPPQQPQQSAPPQGLPPIQYPQQPQQPQQQPSPFPPQPQQPMQQPAAFPSPQMQQAPQQQPAAFPPPFPPAAGR